MRAMHQKLARGGQRRAAGRPNVYRCVHCEMWHWGHNERLK